MEARPPMAVTPSVPWVPRSVGWLAAASGAIVLLAWAFDLDRITGPLQGGATVKANTALCFVFAGAAQTTTAARGVPSRVGSGFALAALTIAIATLAEYAFSWNLQIDQLLCRSSRCCTARSSRMPWGCSGPRSASPGRHGPAGRRRAAIAARMDRATGAR